MRQRHLLSAHRPHLLMYHAVMLDWLRLLCHVRPLKVLSEPLCVKGTLYRSIDLASTSTKQLYYRICVYCAMCVLYKPSASSCVSKAPSVSPSASPTHVPSSNATICEPLCVRDTFCQPIDLAYTCTMQLCYSSLVYRAICVRCSQSASPYAPKAPSVGPSTSPAHVPSSNARLVASIVTCALHIGRL